MVINSDLAVRMTSQANALVRETARAARQIVDALDGQVDEDALELGLILGLRHEARTAVAHLSTIAKLKETIDRLDLTRGAYGLSAPDRISGPSGEIELRGGSDAERDAIVAALNRMHLAAQGDRSRPTGAA